MKELVGVLLQKTLERTFVPSLEVWISSCCQVLVYQGKPGCLQWHQNTQKSWGFRGSGCCIRNQWVLGKFGHGHKISKQHSHRDRHWASGNATPCSLHLIIAEQLEAHGRSLLTGEWLHWEMSCDVENGSDYSKTSDKETCQYHHHNLGQWR